MKLRRVTAWACLGAYLTAVGPAYAQGAAAPKATPKPAPSAPPTASAAPAPAPAAPAAPAAAGAGVADIVRLKDGSMVRGAIIEMTRGESVSILLPNGETRVFNLAQVEYAGPVAGAPAIGGGTAPEAAPSPVPPPPPPAPPLAPPPPPEEPRVHFESAEPLTFGIHTSTADADLGGWRGNLHLRIENYDKLCTSPCDAKLPKGSYQFSVTQDKSTVATDNEVPVKPGDTVHGEYQSYRGLRIAGVVTMIVGGTAGLIYALSYSKTNPEDCDYHSNDYSACLARSSDSSDMSQHLYVGLGVSLGSIVVGSIMLWKKDEASIRVTPGVAPPPGGVGVSDRRSALGYDPRGLTLRASF